jgi:hypothetical protein
MYGSLHLTDLLNSNLIMVVQLQEHAHYIPNAQRVSGRQQQSSGHRVRLQNGSQRVRIPQGCKVFFRSIYIAVPSSTLNMHLCWVYLIKIKALKNNNALRAKWHCFLGD